MFGCWAVNQDPYDNMLVILSGTKHFTMFAPSQRWWLYPVYPAGGHESSTMNDIRDVDMEKFPCFRYATSMDVTLNKGDVMFLPYGWWHQVCQDVFSHWFVEEEKIALNIYNQAYYCAKCLWPSTWRSKLPPIGGGAVAIRLHPSGLPSRFHGFRCTQISHGQMHNKTPP